MLSSFKYCVVIPHRNVPGLLVKCLKSIPELPYVHVLVVEKGRYEHLFADPRLTPNYELQTLKAVQSIAGNKPAEFDDWFQALDWMKSEIDKRDFDIAIIGCGAYGFPLAAYVKQIGKKAVHLGGAV